MNPALRSRMSIKTMLCAAAFPLLLGTAGTAIPDGTPLLIELPPEALAGDVGAGGFVVVGSLYSGGALTWLPTSGAVRLGGSQAVAVSRDRKSIVGNAPDAGGFENAALWTGGQDWRVLGSIAANARACDQLLSSAYGASDDGDVVVGLGWDGCGYAHAFRWEESTGMVDLGSTAAGRSSRANNVSGDGHVVVGWEEAATGVRATSWPASGRRF